MRDQGKKMQTLLAGESSTGSAAGGKVTIVMDGNFGITKVNIDPELLAADKKLKLEEALKDAHADALKKMQRIVMGKMQQSGDFKMPGMS